jgi:hypothetical protein
MLNIASCFVQITLLFSRSPAHLFYNLVAMLGMCRIKSFDHLHCDYCCHSIVRHSSPKPTKLLAATLFHRELALSQTPYPQVSTSHNSPCNSPLRLDSEHIYRYNIGEDTCKLISQQANCTLPPIVSSCTVPEAPNLKGSPLYHLVTSHGSSYLHS